MSAVSEKSVALVPLAGSAGGNASHSSSSSSAIVRAGGVPNLNMMNALKRATTLSPEGQARKSALARQAHSSSNERALRVSEQYPSFKQKSGRGAANIKVVAVGSAEESDFNDKAKRVWRLDFRLAEVLSAAVNSADDKPFPTEAGLVLEGQPFVMYNPTFVSDPVLQRVQYVLAYLDKLRRVEYKEICVLETNNKAGDVETFKARQQAFQQSPIALLETSCMSANARRIFLPKCSLANVPVYGPNGEKAGTSSSSASKTEKEGYVPPLEASKLESLAKETLQTNELVADTVAAVLYCFGELRQTHTYPYGETFLRVKQPEKSTKFTSHAGELDLTGFCYKITLVPNPIVWDELSEQFVPCVPTSHKTMQGQLITPYFSYASHTILVKASDAAVLSYRLEHGHHVRRLVNPMKQLARGNPAIDLPVVTVATGSELVADEGEGAGTWVTFDVSSTLVANQPDISRTAKTDKKTDQAVCFRAPGLWRERCGPIVETLVSVEEAAATAAQPLFRVRFDRLRQATVILPIYAETIAREFCIDANDVTTWSALLPLLMANNVFIPSVVVDEKKTREMASSANALDATYSEEELAFIEAHRDPNNENALLCDSTEDRDVAFGLALKCPSVFAAQYHVKRLVTDPAGTIRRCSIPISKATAETMRPGFLKMNSKGAASKDNSLILLFSQMATQTNRTLGALDERVYELRLLCNKFTADNTVSFSKITAEQTTIFYSAQFREKYRAASGQQRYQVLAEHGLPDVFGDVEALQPDKLLAGDSLIYLYAVKREDPQAMARDLQKLASCFRFASAGPTVDDDDNDNESDAATVTSHPLVTDNDGPESVGTEPFPGPEVHSPGGASSARASGKRKRDELLAIGYNEEADSDAGIPQAQRAKTAEMEDGNRDVNTDLNDDYGY